MSKQYEIWSSVGRFLFSTHAKRAHKLISLDMAMRDPNSPKKNNRLILKQSAESFAQRTGDAAPASARHYATASPAYMEVLGTKGSQRLATYNFKHIVPSDYRRILDERSEQLVPV